MKTQIHSIVLVAMTGIASAQTPYNWQAQQINSNLQQMQQENVQTEQQLRELSEKLNSLKSQQTFSQPAGSPEEDLLREELRRSQLTSKDVGKGSRHKSASSQGASTGLDINGNPKAAPDDFRASRLTTAQPDPAAMKAQQAESELAEQRANLLAEQKKLKKLQAQKRHEIDTTSRADVARCFPDSIDPKSPLNAKAAELYKSLVAQKNPIITNPDAPFIVYSMAAGLLGIKPAVDR